MASGYDVNFNDNIDQRYLCPICLLVMREVVQTACGHRFCEGCLSRAASGQAGLLTCPVDKTISNSSQMFPDVATRREILSLTLTCKNSERDCPWTGELRAMERHLEVCPHEEVTCSNRCGVKVLRKDLDLHHGECPSRSVYCRRCRLQVVFSSFQAHLEACPKVKVNCPVCRKALINREDIKKHTDPADGDCPLTNTSCPFSYVGCDYKAERYQVQKHVGQVDVMQHHLLLTTKMIASNTETILNMQGAIDRLKTKTEELRPTVLNSERRLEEMSREMRERNVTGKLQWKIKLARHHRFRNTSYCSQTFYTGCPGYKVQLTLSMDGQREGSEWFASLSVSLLPGEYDDSLVFPFNATCDVILFDQSTTRPNRANYEQQIVIREVPRVNRPNPEIIGRRTNYKFMARRHLIGPTSKYMRDGCLHFEVTVLHSVFPAPDAGTGLPCPAPPTPEYRRTVWMRNPPVTYPATQRHQQQQQQRQQRPVQASSTPATSGALDTPTTSHATGQSPGVNALAFGS